MKTSTSRALDEAFGPDPPKTRGRPTRRVEPTKTVSFKVPASVAAMGHEKTDANPGILSRLLTVVYALFIERPIHEALDTIKTFEKNRGSSIEELTAEKLHVPDRTAEQARRDPNHRLRLVGGQPDD